MVLERVVTVWNAGDLGTDERLRVVEDLFAQIAYAVCSVPADGARSLLSPGVAGGELRLEIASYDLRDVDVRSKSVISVLSRRPRSYSLSGGICRPSWKISVESTAFPPATRPPISA